MQKLIIWDFDGVIADSEKLWIQVWRETLQTERGFSLTPEQEFELLVGVADRSKRRRLQERFPDLDLDDDFMQKIADGYIYMGTHFMQAIPGVESVMADSRFSHCIATGATREQHTWKMTRFKWIEQYIPPQDWFTVDMVAHGKPAPDIFLLAADKKGFNPKNCLVIGDSLNDFAAASAAQMQAIAFVGATGNNTPQYRDQCLSAGVMAVCATMPEVQQVLNQWYTAD